MIRTRFNQARQWWKSRSRRARWIIVVVLVALIVLVVWRIASRQAPAAPLERQPAVVSVEKLSDIASEGIVAYQGVLEPARAASLIARTGGRVTGVRAQLGDRVAAGSVVIEIDGRAEGNPGRAQVAGLNDSLALFDVNQAAALSAADIARQLAASNLAAVEKTGPLSTEAAALARRQADLAVRSTELALQDAREGGLDAVVRAADIANQNAQLAQDQANVGRQLATRQQGISVTQARLNLSNVQQARTVAATQLASARQQLVTQLRVAQEQLKLQQVSAPLSGVITQLSVREGDFVQPGSTVGEVNALAGAVVRLSVAAGVQSRLAVGQTISLSSNGTNFSGVVSQLSSAPASTTGLSQVEITISATPTVLQPGTIIMAELPVGVTEAGTYFLPLSALTIRQTGAVLFSVSGDGRVVAHPVEVINFSGSSAEVKVSLSSDERIVVRGNRTISEGDSVTIAEN